MKERIVRSAIRCIAEKGIEETSFEAIGKPLGIGRSHVAYHFKDKGDIIRTAIQFVIAQGQALTVERIAAAGDARARCAPSWKPFSIGRMATPMPWRCTCSFYYCTIHEDYRATRCHSPHGGEAPGHGLEARPQIAKGKGDEDLFDLAKSLQYLGFGALVDVLTTSGITPGHWPARKQVLAAMDACWRVFD